MPTEGWGQAAHGGDGAPRVARRCAPRAVGRAARGAAARRERRRGEPDRALLRSAQPQRRRQQPRPPGLGRGGNTYQRLAPANYADGVGAMVSRAEPALHQQPRLRLARRGSVLPAQPQPVGLGLGAVRRPLHRARRTGQRRSEHRRSSQRPAGALQRHPRRDPLHPQRGRARHRHGPGRPAPAGQHGELLHRRRRPLRSAASRDWNGCAPDPDNGNPADAGALLLLPHKFLPLESAPAARPIRRPPMVTEGALTGNRRTRSSRVTRGPTRTPS